MWKPWAASSKRSSYPGILPLTELSMQDKTHIFICQTFSRNFTRGRQLHSKTFTQESGENLYLTWEFKSFLTISDTILLPWLLDVFVQNWFLSDFIDCHMKQSSIHTCATFCYQLSLYRNHFIQTKMKQLLQWSKTTLTQQLRPGSEDHCIQLKLQGRI